MDKVPHSSHSPSVLWTKTPLMGYFIHGSIISTDGKFGQNIKHKINAWTFRHLVNRERDGQLNGQRDGQRGQRGQSGR